MIHYLISFSFHVHNFFFKFVKAQILEKIHDRTMFVAITLEKGKMSVQAMVL